MALRGTSTPSRRVRRKNVDRRPSAPEAAARIDRGRAGQRHSWAEAGRDLVRERANVRRICADTRIACQVPLTEVVRRSISGGPRAILVMEPAEDRSRDDVLGRDTSDGREPTCPEWRLHTKAAMGSVRLGTEFLRRTGNSYGLATATSDRALLYRSQQRRRERSRCALAHAGRGP